MRLVPFRMDGTAFTSPGPKSRPREPPRTPFASVDRAPRPPRHRRQVGTDIIAWRLACRTPGHEHYRRVNHTRSDAGLRGCGENVFPPRRLPWGTNHRLPSIHGAPERAARRFLATYVISVIELPIFSYHGCSDASLLPALGWTFYPPQRVHHSTGPTIGAGEVCRTGHNLRRQSGVWCR